MSIWNRVEFVAVVLVTLLGLGFTAEAQDAALDSHEVERWVASMQELQASADANDQLTILMGSMNDASNFEQMTESAVRSLPVMHEIVQRHGFTDGASWGRTWVDVWTSFLYIMMSEEIPAARARLEAQRQEIEQDPDMDEEARKMMLEELEFAERRLRVPFEVSENNVAVVESYREELEPLFRSLRNRRR